MVCWISMLHKQLVDTAHHYVKDLTDLSKTKIHSKYVTVRNFCTHYITNNHMPYLES